MFSKSIRRATVAVLGMVAATLPVTLQAVATPAASAAAVDQPTELRIGTYNIRADRTMEQFRAATDAFKARVDVGGLQEIVGNQKPNVLREDPDWRIYQAPHLLQVPIIWRADVLEFVDGRERLIAEGRLIEDKSGGLMRKKSTYAVIARLRHVATGQLISVVNVHLIQGAVKGGRKWPGRPRTYGYFVDQMANVRRVMREERAAGFTPYALGDFNVGFAADYRERVRKLPFRRFKSVGMSSIWQGHPMDGAGTHEDTSCSGRARSCGAYIDGVWAQQRPTDVEVAYEVKLSDHWPAIGTYELEPLFPGYRPTTGTVGFARTSEQALEYNKPYQARNAGPWRFELEGDMRHGYVKLQVINGSAEEGKDFTVDASSLFDNNLDENHVDVTQVTDFNPEGDETFTLRLVDPVNTRITVAEATGTILNDD